MATGKKEASSLRRQSSGADGKTGAATKNTLRIVKSPPKAGTLSRAAVRSAVASAVLAHKK